jgi:hypothetical protein
VPRRIFDLFNRAGIEEATTSFSTHGKLLIDTKVKAAKMKVTMGSLMTAAMIKGLPQVKTRDELISIICKEFGLDEQRIKQLAIALELDKGEMDSDILEKNNVSEKEGGVNKK